MKNRSTNEKISIYLAIFFVLVLVVILVLYFLGIIGHGVASVDVVLNKEKVVSYSKSKWKQVSKEKYSDYDWKKFTVYEEGKKKGTYSLYKGEEEFYLFNQKGSQRNSVFVTEDSIYVGGRKSSEFIEFEKEDITTEDEEYIKEVLTQNKVSKSDLNNYIRGYKVISDFDNDNKKETMYVLSNIFSFNVNDTAYSLIFIKDDNKTNFIYKEIISAENRYSKCASSLLGLLKVDGKDNVQIITKCSYYSYSNNTEYGIYQNRYNTYELLLYIK